MKKKRFALVSVLVILGSVCVFLAVFSYLHGTAPNETVGSVSGADFLEGNIVHKVAIQNGLTGEQLQSDDANEVESFLAQFGKCIFTPTGQKVDEMAVGYEKHIQFWSQDDEEILDIWIVEDVEIQGEIYRCSGQMPTDFSSAPKTGQAK